MTHLYTYVILFFRTVLHYDLNQAAYQIKPCGPDETRSNIKGVYVYTEIVSVYVMCQCVCVWVWVCRVVCVMCVWEWERERERERDYEVSLSLCLCKRSGLLWDGALLNLLLLLLLKTNVIKLTFQKYLQISASLLTDWFSEMMWTHPAVLAAILMPISVCDLIK